jgi:predicted ester cyclase
MSEDANIELARRLLAAFEAGDEDAAEALIHPAHREHGRFEAVSGPDGVRAAIRWARETFAERRIVPQDLVASGDRVVARIRVSAVPIGDVCGIAAAGRPLEVEHIHIWRVAGDRLVEHWMVRDDLAAIHQLRGDAGRPLTVRPAGLGRFVHVGHEQTDTVPARTPNPARPRPPRGSAPSPSLKPAPPPARAAP